MAESQRPQPALSGDSDSDTGANEQKKVLSASPFQASDGPKTKKTKRKKGKGKTKVSAEKEAAELAKDQSKDIDKLLEEMRIVAGPSPTKDDVSDEVAQFHTFAVSVWFECCFYPWC